MLSGKHDLHDRPHRVLPRAQVRGRKNGAQCRLHADVPDQRRLHEWVLFANRELLGPRVRAVAVLLGRLHSGEWLVHFFWLVLCGVPVHL